VSLGSLGSDLDGLEVDGGEGRSVALPCLAAEARVVGDRIVVVEPRLLRTVALGGIVVTTAGLILGIVALAAIWFALLWFLICYLFARVSGWTRLRRLYETGSFEGPTSAFSGRVGRSRLRGALIAGATPAGLYMNVTAPFRIFAGPVFIPWHDI